jgi:tRNA (guanine-N7-)-methyltransferase
LAGKNKLVRYKAFEKFSNAFSFSREQIKQEEGVEELKKRFFFKQSKPLVLELGCGKAEYSLELAKRFPNKNFIGIDIKGDRLWKGAKQALEQRIENLLFVRMQIELLTEIFDEGTIDEIWLTFPDPQKKHKREKHRLTNIENLSRYSKILKKGGSVHLKTDSEFLHGYTLGIIRGMGYKILKACADIYKNEEDMGIVKEVQTFYEKRYLKENKPITYIKLSFD